MSRHRKSDPRWRDDASAEVMASCVPQLALGGHVLLAGEAGPLLRQAIEFAGVRVTPWLRRATGLAGAAAASAWPADETYSAALLRLPRAKEELDMMLHAAAARVAPGGIIAVYGANDEGIKSAAARIEPLLGPVEAASQRAHCRVLVARVPSLIPGLRPDLGDWRLTGPLEIAGTARPWVTYPGVFAKGGLDAGTRLLLATLDPARLTLPETARVLDFACGTGVIAAHVRSRWPAASVDMADWDTLAVLAATQNAAGARGQVVSHLEGFAGGSCDLIVSNPPIHDGKSEDYTVLGRLIAQAPAGLSAKGTLLIVVQGRVPVQEWLSAAFGQVETWAQDTRYRVWLARQPKSHRPTGVRPRAKPGANANSAKVAPTG